LRLVRVPLYAAQYHRVTGRESQKRPCGAAFDEPVREGREVDSEIIVSVTRMAVSNARLVFAGFDVVVDDHGENHKNPHWEDAHSRNRFRNQARQNCPSTAKD
jgi:hypothetical protein